MVKVAVIGFGYWGPNFCRNLYLLPQRPLYGICDASAERLAVAEYQYPNVRVTDSYHDFLASSEVNAVVIATPAATHYGLVKACLQAGKHVLVEKPLALTSAECRELIDLAARADRTLMVGHTFAYSPAVKKLSELVSTGELGEVYYVYASRLNLGQIRQDVNALWNLAPHDVSIILSLLAEEPCRVAAWGYSFIQPGIEDVVFINMKFPGGSGASIHVSWLDPGKVRRTTIVGSRKMVVYDDTNSEAPIRIYDKGVSRQEKLPAPPFDSFGEFRMLLRAGDVLAPRIEPAEPLRIECMHFLECISQGRQPITDGLSGLKVVKVLEAAQESLTRGGVPVTLDGEE